MKAVILAGGYGSFSLRKGTLRGLLYQILPHAEAELVRCTRGAIYEVMIDLRRNAATLGKWFGVELSAQNGRLLYVPENFARGYQALENDTEVACQVSQFYCAEAERGIRWDDPAFRIEWPEVGQRDISQKDLSWPLMLEQARGSKLRANPEIADGRD